MLFWYPAAMTYGCTKESCHFRDLKAEFAAVGAQRVGISADQVEKQKRFPTSTTSTTRSCRTPTLTVARKMGVKRTMPIVGNRRTTFVIDTDRTVLAVFRSELSMNSHADRALELLRQRQQTS